MAMNRRKAPVSLSISSQRRYQSSQSVVVLSQWLLNSGGATIQKKVAVEPSSALEAHIRYRTARIQHQTQPQQHGGNSASEAAVAVVERGLVVKEDVPEGAVVLSVPLSACLSVLSYPSAVLDPRHPSYPAFIAQYPTFKSIPPPLKFFRALRTMVLEYNTYVEHTNMGDDEDGGGAQGPQLLNVSDRELEYLWLGCVIGATATELQSHHRQKSNTKKSVAGEDDVQTPDFFEQLPFSHMVATFPTNTTPFMEAMQYYSESSHSPLSAPEKALLTTIHSETSSLLDMAAEVCSQHHIKSESTNTTSHGRGRRQHQRSSSEEEGDVVGLVGRDHIEWGFRQVVSRATILPFAAATSPLDVGTWMEQASDEEQTQSALHAAIVPLLDMINHPPSAPAIKRARSPSSNLPDCEANAVVIVSRNNGASDSGVVSTLKKRRDVNVNSFEEDPDLLGVVLHPEHNDIELDGNSAVLEAYDENGRSTTSINHSDGGASLRDFSVVLMTTSKIGKGSEVFVGYDLPEEEAAGSVGDAVGDVAAPVTDIAVREEKVAALYRFGFL